MKTVVIGKGLKPGEQLRQRAEKKLSKFDRYFGDEAEATVRLSAEGDQKCIEITIRVKGHIYRSETLAGDALEAFDRAMDLMERQIRKQKTKFEKQIRDYAYMQEYLRTLPSEEELEVEREEPHIARQKQFELIPLQPEEACLQMEMLGHNFHLFISAETGNVAVVYKRRDGNYGLLEGRQ